MPCQTFNVQSINRHRLGIDGVGVTSLVSLMGCPLSCRYCINMNVLGNNQYRGMTPEQLYEVLNIDYCYFIATKGGVTFGGGESLLYADAILDFAKVIPDGVYVNLETSLNVDINPDKLEKLCNICQGLIIDIKTLDETLYREYTGKDNQFVLRNLDFICSHGYADKCRIRIPVIPGVKDREKALEEEKKIKTMGFEDTEVFGYVIRDYMNE